MRSQTRRPLSVLSVGNALGLVFGLSMVTFSLLRAFAFQLGASPGPGVFALRLATAAGVASSNVAVAGSCFLTVVLWYGMLSSSASSSGSARNLNAKTGARKGVFLGGRRLRLVYCLVIVCFGVAEFGMRGVQLVYPEGTHIGLTAMHYVVTMGLVMSSVILSIFLGRRVRRVRAAAAGLSVRGGGGGAGRYVIVIYEV
jgi:hypothetical protein